MLPRKVSHHRVCEGDICHVYFASAWLTHDPIIRTDENKPVDLFRVTCVSLLSHITNLHQDVCILL